MLHGIITAIVTPMNNDDSIDYASLTKLINFQLNNNINGIVLLGSTGEANTINQEEKINIIHHAIKVIANKVPLIVGVSQISTKEALSYVNELNKIPEIEYLLVVTPPYVKAPQRGLFEHFALISKATNKKIILYNVPSRTASDLHDDTILKLSKDFKNIIGLKDATGNINRLINLLKERQDKFLLFSGDDPTAQAFLSSGGDGVISVTSNVMPKLMLELYKNIKEGNLNKAIEINNKLFKLHNNLFIESNPIPVKWALSHMQLISNTHLRLPLMSLDNKYHDLIIDSIKAANYN